MLKNTFGLASNVLGKLVGTSPAKKAHLESLTFVSGFDHYQTLPHQSFISSTYTIQMKVNFFLFKVH